MQKAIWALVMSFSAAVALGACGGDDSAEAGDTSGGATGKGGTSGKGGSSTGKGGSGSGKAGDTGAGGAPGSAGDTSAAGSPGGAGAPGNCTADLTPPGQDADCPDNVCTGGCMDGVCTIDCSNQACDGQDVVCPPDYACVVECFDTDACDGGSVTCPDDYACLVQCDGEDACGGDFTLDCGATGSCALECGPSDPEPCTGATVNCGSGACSASCDGNSVASVSGCQDACSCAECG